MGFIDEHQGLGSIYGRRHEGLTVDQAMQQVEDMGLGWNAGLQGHLHGQEHGILIVLQNQGQDVDHLAVTAGLLEQVLLQRSEGLGQLDEWRARCAGHQACAEPRPGSAASHRPFCPADHVSDR